MGLRFRLGLAAAVSVCACGLRAQVIEFESGGLKYQTLSRAGVTIMVAPLPDLLRDYSVIQVGISNGSEGIHTVRPEDFRFERRDGTALQATPARAVVDHLLGRASRNDVIKLVSTYESTLFSGTRFRSTNGYEQRRQAALAELGSTKLKAAAAASAIALVETRLSSGQSTDGAVFFYTSGKSLGAGRYLIRAGGQLFEFDPAEAGSGKALQHRGETQP